MGACLDGYMSDMTRMAFLGVPTKRVRMLYDAVLEAQMAGIEAVRPGVTAAKVDGAARKVLKRHGLDRQFVHSTGHGLGLEIHEGPRIGKKDPTKLQAGMVITIEPGAYIDRFGGVRIEDTVLVTASGCEVLTPTTKEFVHLMTMTIDEIRELLDLFNESGVGELEIERDGERIRIRKAGQVPEYTVSPVAAVTAPAQETAPGPAPAGEESRAGTDAGEVAHRGHLLRRSVAGSAARSSM